MYSLLLLNTQSFPSLDVHTLTQFLQKTFVRAIIKSPFNHLEVTEAMQYSESSSSLFLILNNKKKSPQMKDIAYELTQREKRFLVYYVGLQNYQERTVKTFQQIVRKVKSQFYGENIQSRVPLQTQSSQILVISVQSNSGSFKNVIRQIKSKIQQCDDCHIQFQQNYNFSDTQSIDQSPYTILIINDQELYRYESSYSYLINRIPKNKLVTVVYSQTATIPYGFRFDQLVTNSEQLTTKTMWLIKSYTKFNSFSTHSNIISSIQTNKRQSNLQNQISRVSSTSKRTSIINKENALVSSQEQKNRKKSILSQNRRQSRKSRSSKRGEIELNFNWVIKKKPSGCFVTIPESQFRKHGIKNTFYGSQGGSIIKDNKRTSIDQGQSSILRSQLQKLQSRLNKQPSILIHRNSSRQGSKFQSQSSKIMNVEPKIIINPRRHSSTAGYNELNLQQLLLFQQNLQVDDIIPSTMSFGSLQSTYKQINQDQGKNTFYMEQNSYFNTDQFQLFPRNSPKLQSRFGSNFDYSVSNYQSNSIQNTHNPHSHILSDNKSIIKSSLSRSKSRLSTLKFRIPTLYVPYSLQKLKYQIKIHYPNQFSLVEYRNIAELDNFLLNLSRSINPSIILDEIHANQALRFLQYNKQTNLKIIIFSQKLTNQNQNYKAHPSVKWVIGDQNLLKQLDNIQR